MEDALFLALPSRRLSPSDHNGSGFGLRIKSNVLSLYETGTTWCRENNATKETEAFNNLNIFDDFNIICF
jgi:hypothetical protein